MGGNQDAQCNVPAPPPGTPYVEVAAGLAHTLLRRSDGFLEAWGWIPRPDLRRSQLRRGLELVEARWASYSAGRRSDGSLVAWGNNLKYECEVPVLPVV